VAGFLAMMRDFGISKVVIIHDVGGPDERRVEVDAHIQPKMGFFEIEAPIYEGDVVELDDPRGGKERRTAARVDIASNAPDGMAHTEVTWGKSTPTRVAAVRRLGLENLHPNVIAASSDLFVDGHYQSAVSEAFKSLEVRVRELAGGKKSGVSLMGEAFGGKAPKIDVATEAGQSGDDEREGFLALFRGAMLGVRNPRAHELFKPEDPQQALEYLAFASLLHRRLDVADSASSSAEE
jgi:uncharacterized protein (TIGR02391 family)